jgi:surface carbohydrate biosynthesis protein
MKNKSSQKNVTLLVDNKWRDLMVATLIAAQLERAGLRCHLEPLEGWRGALAAHKPNLIIFNHLTASHLVEYSRRLADMGVLTAVLPNEGILYDTDVMDYNAGKHHNGAHIDLFFCWNEVHRQALLRCGFDRNTQIEVIGVPRFDFYFAPWSGAFDLQPARPAARPRVLICTNFVFARYFDLPQSVAGEYFREWTCIPGYRDYWSLIKVNHASRAMFFPFLEKAVAARKFDITLRPHPNEDRALYQKWHDRLSPELKKSVSLDPGANITQLLLNCDVEVACETCTTTLESWVAGKPTVELVLQKHPVFFHPDIANLGPVCDDPSNIAATIEQALLQKPDAATQRQRAEHLRQWCDSPKGDSAAKMAEAVVKSLENQPEPDWSKLRLADFRRGAKLKLLKRLGLPYHFDPLLGVKKWGGGRYKIKAQAYRKSIRPSDVREARRRLEIGCHLAVRS